MSLLLESSSISAATISYIAPHYAIIGIARHGRVTLWHIAEALQATFLRSSLGPRVLTNL